NWYDYGARHYDAALGRWNAVDTMAEKYYGVSPYAYCKNNPILRVDIDGMYDYTIDKLGYISKTGKAGNDRLLSTNKHIKPININSGEVLDGMLKMQKDFLNPSKVIYNSTNNMEDATNIFKFAADNTSVEWKLDVYDDKGSTTAIIGTKHYEDRVFSDVQKDLNVKGEKVFDLHSHPYNNVASKNDMDALKVKTGAIYHKDTETMFFYNSKDKHIINEQISDKKIISGKDIFDVIQKHLK
uniref:JAB-like toxin 1 domain-containing protein n=1 Tax=uncultured Bacteroides sp. TaxID=162156 RepID=UPI0025F3D4EB